MPPSTPSAARVADPDRLRECVHCGLCLNACPTYLELGTEMDSPRGRIYLIKQLAEGGLSLDREVVRHLDLCLGCRACEPACPSGVQYGSIIEEARAHVERFAPRSWRARLRRAAILAIFPHPSRLRLLMGLAQLARGLRLWPAVRRLVPAAALLPAGAQRRPGPLRPGLHAAQGRERARVGLLTGCVADVLCGEVNAAAVRTLSRAGVAVVVPGEQGCCGALHLHSGDPDGARRLARRNLTAFPSDLDAVVVTAAGCGAAMKEYGALLGGDPLAERAAAFAGRVRDIVEVVAQFASPPPAHPRPQRVTYHDACHLAHAQGVRATPRQLLAALPGLDLIELEESDVCCGSAGSYNLNEAEMARRLRERKIDHIAASGAACVAVGNPGCALQIRAGLAARGLDVRVAHPVELWNEAYESSEGAASAAPSQRGATGNGT